MAAVYPRLCGERVYILQNFDINRGLSPALRGTLHSNQGRRLSRRFIPGSAGNALTVKRLTILISVYPRLCGERVDIESMTG